MKPVDLADLPPNGTIARQKSQGSSESAQDNAIGLDISYIFDAPHDANPVRRADIEGIAPETVAALKNLKTGKGDFQDGGTTMLGWQSLPDQITNEHLSRIEQVARKFSDDIDAYVSVGIGGSYLGIEATVTALTHTHFNSLSREERGGAPEVYFLGQNVDPDYFRDTLDQLRGKRVGINVLSKSGTTTETAIAFRILRQLLEKAQGAAADRYILATTDADKGALRKLANDKGYTSFVIPNDIGGRFSVLSDVGLVGMAVAGIDIRQFVAGFRQMKQRTEVEDFWRNPALVHAAVRSLAWRKGKKIEVVATNAVSLYNVARFMEQLFPESEGQGGQGLWVSPSIYSEKLHANGQMVQQGERNILETFLRLGAPDSTVPIPNDPTNADGLNYLSDNQRDMGFINNLVIEGPAYAHFQGGVPNMTLTIPRRSAHCLGQLYFMLERSVAISGSLLGHNPFIQPGVEAYKKAVFALAGKPGFETEGDTVRGKLAVIPQIKVT